MVEENSGLIPMMNRFLGKIRHCTVLGLRVARADENKVVLELPYSNKIIGNPASGVIAGGALTTLMDSACGFAVPLALKEAHPAPTLDLRIDYMTAATPDEPVFGEAEVYRIAKHVVFVRAIAYQKDKSKPIAHCVATFARVDPTTLPGTSPAEGQPQEKTEV